MFKTLPGFRDFYPEDCAVRNHLFRLWRETALRYGFAEFDGPVLEPLELFTTKSGEEIAGQLFNFTDKGGREVALRPEMTPTLARMVGAKANALRRPVKWFSIGENFRYERQQKGRLRAFYQLNADLLGEASVHGDAEIIALLIQLFRAFGLTQEHFRIRLSDRSLWLAFLKGEGLSDDETMQALGIIDKLERAPKEATLEALEKLLGDKGRAEALLARITELASLKCLGSLQRFFGDQADAAVAERIGEWQTLLGLLDAMGLGDFVQVDLGIVRGLAYYTGFVFEAFQTVGEGRALAGGGRYDNLVEKLGGTALPAVGFGLGDVTLRNLLEETKLLPNLLPACDVYVVIGSDGAYRSGVRLAQLLREGGYRVEYPMRPVGFGKQFKQADQCGARLAAIIGDDEQERSVVKLRDLSRREEKEVPATQVLPAIAHFFMA